MSAKASAMHRILPRATGRLANVDCARVRIGKVVLFVKAVPGSALVVGVGWGPFRQMFALVAVATAAALFQI